MNLYSTIMSVREYLSSPSHTSTFTSTGQLTPEEFVDAGDYLTYKFPTWSWQPAAPGKSVSHLPEAKQFLKLLHAPCHSRLDDSFSPWNPGEAIEGVDEWEDNTPTKDGDPPTPAKVKTVDDKGVEEEEEEDEEIPDMDDDEEDDDEAIIKEGARGKSADGKSGKSPLRYYNLYLAYSTYYRTPRLYISGHDGATGLPLTPPTIMFEDIAPDYREKTVTIEEFPPEGTLMATVHPCKHAEAMKRIFDSMLRRKEREDWEEVPPANSDDKEEETVARAENDSGLRVDQYMVVFVKFIAGVVPGVEMDYTMSI
ncbi:unnamed protein product [Tuber aestivum]|uniref:Autophagy-related protein 3 n=1 Tax=Tuber aestivum TaxID=59557 RepID=A0A292PSW0_9PEZI|nr:unnamed protein product [Tuber aestivum]